MTTMTSQKVDRRRVLPWLAFGPVLAACSAPGAGGPAQDRAPVAAGVLRSVAVVTQSSPNDAFWSVLKNGAMAAGKQLGVRVDYYTNEDPYEQAKLIDNAVAQRVDGLVVSMAYPEPLRASIERAVAAGIPVVTTNSSHAENARLGAIGHVGNEPRLIMAAAGKRLHDAGKTRLLIVNHMAGQVTGDEYCAGATQGFGNSTTTVVVDINNPADVQSRIKSALEADRSIDAVLAFSGQIAARAVAAAQEAHSTAAIATSSLNSEVINAIRAGTLLFAADPQQYEQGYLPIVLLQLYKSNLDTVGGGLPIPTGPSFVDKSNVDAIAKLVTQGTR